MIFYIVQCLLLLVNFSDTKTPNRRIRMSSFPADIDQIRKEILATLSISGDFSIEILDESTGRFN